MARFSISDRAWVPKAVAAIHGGDEVVVDVDGDTIRRVFDAVRGQAAVVAQLTEEEAKHASVGGSVAAAASLASTLNPAAFVAALAGVGALGGAAGSVAVVSVAAHLRGYDVEFAEVVPAKFSGVSSLRGVVRMKKG